MYVDKVHIIKEMKTIIFMHYNSIRHVICIQRLKNITMNIILLASGKNIKVSNAD